VASTTLTANNLAPAFGPVTATGGTGTLVFGVSPALPQGLLFNSQTGSVTGTPIATIPATTFTVTVTDRNGASASASFSLTVLAPVLTLAPATLSAPQVGVPYAQMMVATGGIGPYTYSVASGSLPAGLTLALNGNLSGTPTTAQASSFSIAALDRSPGSGPYSVSVAYSVNVQPGIPALAFPASVSSTSYVYGEAPFAVQATSVSTGSITYSVVSGPATVNAASGLVTLQGAGTVVLKAAQAATANYVAATAQATLTAAREAATIGIAASATSVTPVQPITFTATVKPTSLGSPTGTVTFYDGGTAISSAIPLVQGSAQLQVPNLTSGAHTITASYSGDTNFLSDSANAQSVTPIDITVAPLTFTLALQSGANETVEPGSTVQFTVAVDPTYGQFPGPVTFVLAGLPSGSTYTVTPATLAANAGPTNVVVSITVPAASARDTHDEIWHRSGYLAVALLLPLAAFGRSRRRLSRGFPWLALLCVSVALGALLSGCGSQTGYLTTPVQNYPITFTATSGAISQSTVVNLQVQ
jgi:hypothetical protein